ncbi:restriction endonuclease [uncultured Megasphaera sp.]|uniref:restriction endonuclease n=1 Tax=uncultured Megasphaera sp. TaxID=165188 RepID=UPI0026075270|nr:restriction endonuclease [uncultured Megasphaera sp.]
METTRVWGIHTRDDALFKNSSVIAIGWAEFGDFRAFGKNRDAMKKHYAEIYAGKQKERAFGVCTGQLYRFAYEMQIGDYVVHPSKADRMINIGKIVGDYEYKPEAKNPFEYVNQRKVQWINILPRTAFSQAALYEVGSAMSVFQLSKNADEFLKAADPSYVPKFGDNDDGEDDTVAATADDIIDSTKDFILKTLSKELKGYNLEDFVADLMNAMGYRTQVSARGGDSGIDIVAYKDELPPRIAVQVKSGDGDIKETTIQSLKGAMMPGDYGLFVTLTNYTKNAQKFLDANPIIRGINGNELTDLVLKYYEGLSKKYQNMIPLKKVYIPVVTEDQ